MSKNLFACLIVLALILFCIISIFPQADIIENTGGIVIDVSSTEITISEYDAESDAYNNVTFLINEDTEIIGIDSIEDLSNDDLVEIEYTVKDDTKIALSIYVEELNRFEE